jgi:hypothetical protein
LILTNKPISSQARVWLWRLRIEMFFLSVWSVNQMVLEYGIRRSVRLKKTILLTQIKVACYLESSIFNWQPWFQQTKFTDLENTLISHFRYFLTRNINCALFSMIYPNIQHGPCSQEINRPTLLIQIRWISTVSYSIFDLTQILLGVHNFYLGLETDGKAHGVFVLNTNAQEVETGPGPHLVYRAIGGRFEVFIFPGPKPEDVIKQYQQVIGKPYLPAFWALGYQFSRYGFKLYKEYN